MNSCSSFENRKDEHKTIVCTFEYFYRKSSIEIINIIVVVVVVFIIIIIMMMMMMMMMGP